MTAQTTETNGKRGRVALTPEQKVQKQTVLDRYHGIGEHTLSASIKVTAKERATLRSFCKSLNKPFFGTGELMAGILRHTLLGYETSVLDGESSSEYIKVCAAKYDAENESPEVLAVKKEIQKYENVRDGYMAKGETVPAAIMGIIEFHKLALAELMPEYLATEETDEETDEAKTE